jgi:DNA-binding LytR/AlgR family response regulator
MNQRYTCLIVDDEPAAHYVLANYIERVPHLELAGQCYNVLEAISFLHERPVDLLFLDIHMPEMTGFDLLRTLVRPPKVILTTAYSEFALESYEYWVIDYLLKPIDFPRFLKAFERFIALQPAEKDTAVVRSEAVLPTSLMVKVDAGMVRIYFSELLYTQSMGNYVRLITEKQAYLATITTAELEQRLPAEQFMRIHKSHIVALSKITRFTQNSVMIGDTELPVGITYRRELGERMR